MTGSCSAKPRGIPIKYKFHCKRPLRSCWKRSKQVIWLFSSKKLLAHIAPRYSHKPFGFPTLSAVHIAHVPVQDKYLSVSSVQGHGHLLHLPPTDWKLDTEMFRAPKQEIVLLVFSPQLKDCIIFDGVWKFYHAWALKPFTNSGLL